MEIALRTQLDRCLRRIEDLPEERRHEMLPQLHSLTAALRGRGEPVPPRMRDLVRQMGERRCEARFDNMPV